MINALSVRGLCIRDTRYEEEIIIRNIDRRWVYIDANLSLEIVRMEEDVAAMEAQVDAEAVPCLHCAICASIAAASSF